MAEELGKIERPEVTEFKQGRRLFFVPLVTSVDSGDLELTLRIGKYWDQVEAQINNLENRLGKVNCIFYEMVTGEGEKAIEIIETMCKDSLKITRSLMEAGARLYPLEDAEILLEFIDWGRCLNIGLQSNTVFNQVYDSYKKARQRRDDAIIRKIDENLGSEETGILIMQEEHGLQFPPDIQVIYVSPPALDELKRWARDMETRAQKEEKKDSGNKQD
jgi:hypothetical protein